MLIGSNDKKMSKISLNKFTNDNSYSKVEIDIHDLEPQTYILITAPMPSTIPYLKLGFSVDYKKGEFFLSNNMNTGINDRLVLPVKKTLLNFLLIQ